jgi:transcriptional regulator with XRE-family HTH domain
MGSKKPPVASRGPRRSRVDTPFAKNLAHILKERQLTAKAAAEICGVAPSVIADWLGGGAPANPLAVQKLATALQVSFEWLLTGTTTSVAAPNISLTELFEEHDVGLNGIFKIEAKRLVRR